MTLSFWTICAGFCFVFTALETALYCHRRYRHTQQQNLLYRAKEEAREIAQLPLSNPHPLIQIDKDGNVLFANFAAFESFPEIKEQGTLHPVLKNVIEQRCREVGYEDKIYHQTITPAKANNEEAFVVYFYDVTEQKQYEKKLKEAYKETEKARIMAEQAKEARGEFLANMSHELRTPMNGIIGLSDILVETGLSGEKQELIEALNSSSRNLLILLNDILDFSKIEAGELAMEETPFDIRKTVKQIESLQRPVASQKSLALESKVAGHVPESMIGDPARLQQVLNNLIGNALKFTEDGSVTLRVDGKKDHAEVFMMNISVTDTGIGIAQDKQDKIFEKFQQADTSTARKYGGTGLGLTITKRLVELMGGSVTIESEEGKGTTFNILIPMRIDDNIEKKYQSESALHKHNGINTQARLMIVDDHPVNLLFMRQVLYKIGFQNFDEAASGKQALALFETQPYDLILMDCQMPEMDGFEAVRKLREIETAENEPVIIAVTANAMKGAEEKCMKAGMDDYISKPVDKSELRKLLQRWLPGHNPHIQMDLETDQKLMDGRNKNAEIFDWARLAEFTEGDSKAEKELVSLFIDSLKEDLKHLEQSLEKKDYEEWDSWAHKLYGACSHIGANALAEVCEEAQTLFPEKIQQIPVQHRMILGEYARVRDALNTRKAA